MSSANDLNDRQVFGHKPGLFLLFFTEMWERFSYYGMRALLTIFLVSEIAAGGWGWSRESALQLYAMYTGLVYLTPIIGGIAADKFLGYRGAVLLGALLMTLGHASMALESPWSFYTGLGLLILGNGFFKPNISSIVGQLYIDEEDKKDGAYTIFYMGINAGAFLGILLCGYVGEKVAWSYGFGLAGIFMFLGMIMFYLGQVIFGELGKLVKNQSSDEKSNKQDKKEEEPHVVRDRLIVIGLLSFFTIFFWWAFEQAGGSMSIFAKDYTGRVLSGSYASIYFWVNTLLTVVPLAVVTYVLLKLVSNTFGHIPFSNLSIVLSFVIIWVIAIWMLQMEFKMRAFDVRFNIATEVKIEEPDKEPDGGKQDEVASNLPEAADLEKLLANAIVVIPGLESDSGLSYFQVNDDKFPFKSVDDINLRDLVNYFHTDGEIPQAKVSVAQDGATIIGKKIYSTIRGELEKQKKSKAKDAKKATAIHLYVALGLTNKSAKNSDEKTEVKLYKIAESIKTFRSPDELKTGQTITLVDLENKNGGGKLRKLSDEQAEKFKSDFPATIIEEKQNETEIPASWFGILNSFFIIAFAPFFSRVWESRLNPSAPVKFALGLILLGLGFGVLAIGSMGIKAGAQTATVSIWWLIFAYLFHTLGELCLSPVGLSYVSKLAPLRLVGLMFGIWFGATAIANYLAGYTGSYIDKISEHYGLSTFFLIFTLIPIAAGLVIWGMNGWIKKKMHGIH